MSPDQPYHAHVYYSADERGPASALRNRFASRLGAHGGPKIRFVGRMMDQGVGPHPIAQFEVHFLASTLDWVVSEIEASGLRSLVHPLTDDDLADHTRLGRWIGEPVALDLSVLDPPGHNQGIARFGKTDF